MTTFLKSGIELFHVIIKSAFQKFITSVVSYLLRITIIRLLYVYIILQYMA